MIDLERPVEGALWQSRFLAGFAVAASLVVAAALTWIACVDTFRMAVHALPYGSPSLSPEAIVETRLATIIHAIEIVDVFLLSGFFLIFAFGMYELFISKLEVESDRGTHLLDIRSLDGLKSRLAKVILIVLVVKYFEHVLSLKVATPLDALMVGGGIAFIGLALWLGHAADKPGGQGG